MGGIDYIPKNNRPVIQKDLEGNIVNIFDSVKAAAKQFGGKVNDVNRISHALRKYTLKRRKSEDERKGKAGRPYSSVGNKTFGYLWEYKED
jgi:hypothetical protein